MADNSRNNGQGKRAARKARQEALEQERRAQAAKDRKQQTIIGVIVIAVVVVLVAIAGVAVYRSLHPAKDAAQTAQTKDEAYAALQSVDTKPARADDEGGILVSKDGYGKAIDDVPTIGIYMDFMCPGCGSLNRNLDQDLVTMVNAGQINLDLHFMSFMDSYSTDEYSSRAANMALSIAEQDEDPTHLFKFMENMYASDFQPQEGSGYQSVSDDQIRQQALDAGVDESVADSGVTRKYDDWLSAVNTYTPKRSELWNVTGTLKGSMSTPTMTINGYYWNLNDAEVTGKATMTEALLESIGLPQDDMGKEGKLPSIGADGKPLLGAVDPADQQAD